MASAMIHIAVANEVNKHIKKDISKYLIGAIAPDIAKLVGIDRNLTHFQDKDKEYPDINRFLDKYKNKLDDDFVMGYYIHLLTDFFWYKYFYTEFVKDNTIIKSDGSSIKLDKKILRELIYNDYTNLNINLIDVYDLNLKIFYNELPEIDKIIEEIPMDKLKILVDKMGIIIENSTNHKSYLFNMGDVKEFIELCISLIIGIIDEKKEISF